MTTENTIIRPFAPNAETLKQLTEYYNTHGKLPTNKVTCTVSGYATTLFGDNLKRRVEKFGGIENLLTKFVCEEQLRKDKAKGIVYLDLPARSSGGGKRKKNLSQIQIDEQIRQLEAMKLGQANKSEEIAAEEEQAESTELVAAE